MTKKELAENELYFPEYIKPVKEEEDPESIDYKGADMSEDERMEYEEEKACKTEDYDDRYMGNAK